MNTTDIVSNVSRFLQQKVEDTLKLFEVKAYSGEEARWLLGDDHPLQPEDLYLVALGRPASAAKPCVGTLLVRRSMAADWPEEVADCLSRKLRNATPVNTA